MAYSNKHLTEVICGFIFTQESIAWDSTYFGQYYEKIKELGFTEREERKGIQIELGGNLNNLSAPSFASQEIDDVVIFKNQQNGWAIMMGKNKISFHVVHSYEKWETFLDNLIKPFYQKYLDLGLGNGPRQCNVMYLNRFLWSSSKHLSDYFTIITSMLKDFGEETKCTVERMFNNEKKNLLITKLTSQAALNGQNNINLQCGSVCIDQDCIQNPDWEKQANETHSPVRPFFESIITEKLRAEL